MRHNFKELLIWKKSVGLAKTTYTALKKFPVQDANTLGYQIRKSAISISSNIAEGAGRNSDSEFFYFLGVAKGSLYELHSQVILANELELMDKTTSSNLIKEIEALTPMIQSFQDKIKPNNNKPYATKEPFTIYLNKDEPSFIDCN